MDHESWKAECKSYLGERTGTYRFRCKRYAVVLDALIEMGFASGDVVVDVGAGEGEFGLYIREQFPDYQHTYVPIDGAIDGVDLETWVPNLPTAFYVSIEVMEHLVDPHRILRYMRLMASKGVAITTPNPECTDVLGMDRTHKTPLSMAILASWGMTIQPMMIFTEDRLDTILGSYKISKGETK